MPKKPNPVAGVYEREPGNWCGRYRIAPGKLVRKSFGNDRRAAIAWVEEMRTIRRKGEVKLPASAKPVQVWQEPEKLDDNEVTVGRLCDEFLKYLQAHPDEYRDQRNPPYRIGLIREAFGERPAASLLTSEIEDWLDGMREDHEWANATVNKLRGTFSKVYKHGKRKDLVAVNPAVDVPLRDVGNYIERFLTIDEEKRIRAVLQAEIDAHDLHPQLRKQAIQRQMEFDVSLRSGMRKSEQYLLRWCDVDFDRRIMRLRKTKNGKPRNAFIIADVAAALRTMQGLDVTRRDRSRNQPNMAPKDTVFSKDDNKKWWAAALDKANVSNYRWHENRHTFCSRLVQVGVHLKIVQEAAGHASIASTMRYAHFAPSQVVDAMAVLNWKPNEQSEANAA